MWEPASSVGARCRMASRCSRASSGGRCSRARAGGRCSRASGSVAAACARAACAPVRLRAVPEAVRPEHGAGRVGLSAGARNRCRMAGQCSRASHGRRCSRARAGDRCSRAGCSCGVGGAQGTSCEFYLLAFLIPPHTCRSSETDALLGATEHTQTPASSRAADSSCCFRLVSCLCCGLCVRGCITSGKEEESRRAEEAKPRAQEGAAATQGRAA